MVAVAFWPAGTGFGLAVGLLKVNGAVTVRLYEVVLVAPPPVAEMVTVEIPVGVEEAEVVMLNDGFAVVLLGVKLQVAPAGSPKQL